MKSKNTNTFTNKTAQLSHANHLLCGGGGARAVLAALGVFLAFELSGLRFRTIGGISGGAIPTALLASGMNIRKMLELGLNLDFGELLKKRNYGPVFMDVLAYRLSNRRPPRGLYDSSELGDFVARHCQGWPTRYWTASLSDKSIYAFLPQGVYRSSLDGTYEWQKIRRKSFDIALAIRSTVAIPGLIDAVPSPFRNNEFLFDGGLGPEANCPISIPQSLESAALGRLIVVDVGPETSASAKRFNQFWRIACGEKCMPKFADLNPCKHLLVIKPEIRSLDSFDFFAGKDKKWLAIIEGYKAAYSILTESKLLTGRRKDLASSLLSTFSETREDLLSATKTFELALIETLMRNDMFTLRNES